MSGSRTSFIKFDHATRSVTWFTNDKTKTGTYTIEITATVTAASTWTKTVMFTLTV
jgi:hypothetical protein